MMIRGLLGTGVALSLSGSIAFVGCGTGKNDSVIKAKSTQQPSSEDSTADLTPFFEKGQPLAMDPSEKPIPDEMLLLGASSIIASLNGQQQTSKFSEIASSLAKAAVLAVGKTPPVVPSPTVSAPSPTSPQFSNDFLLSVLRQIASKASTNNILSSPTTTAPVVAAPEISKPSETVIAPKASTPEGSVVAPVASIPAPPSTTTSSTNGTTEEKTIVSSQQFQSILGNLSSLALQILNKQKQTTN